MTDVPSIANEVSHILNRIEHGPLSFRTLRAVEALRSVSIQERVVERIVAYVANLVVPGASGAAGESGVRFCEITTDDDWRRVRELRARCYPTAAPYLVDVLAPDGSDRYDRNSFVYAAFVDDRAVATIRATAFPYETLEYLSADELASFLGEDWKTDYIEWGRLLVDGEYSKMRLTPALITYAGLRLLTLTRYRSYFGYTKPNVRQTISKFAIERDTLRFQIPSRGSHHYLLTKGHISTTAARELPKWLWQLLGRAAGVDGPSAFAAATVR